MSMDAMTKFSLRSAAVQAEIREIALLAMNRQTEEGMTRHEEVLYAAIQQRLRGLVDMLHKWREEDAQAEP